LLTAVGILLVGLAMLFLGGAALVRGAARLGHRFGLSPLFIGLTLVAWATSLPELVVSLLAAVEGSPSIAVGNVVGSNIMNIGAVLGLSFLVRPLGTQGKAGRRDLFVSIAATVLVALFALSGWLSRVEAVLLLGAMALYLAWSVRLVRREQAATLAAYEAAGRTGWGRGSSLAPVAILVPIGVALLILGAQIVIDSAIHIAIAVGVDRAVIGLTIVAAGTSLRELATSVTAAWKRESGIALGNVLGSNIFNLLAILGISGAVTPLRVVSSIVRYDLVVALLFSLALVPMIFARRRGSRLAGALLFAGYVGYCVWLISWRGPVG
jgi:cation:H+ antiporter